MKIAENADDFILTGQMQADSSWPEWSGIEKRTEWLNVWHDRFGISPEYFDSYELCSSSRTVYIIRRSTAISLLSSMPVQMVGMPFLRYAGRYMKPVTCALQRFGSLARRNVLELDIERLCMLCRAGEITIAGVGLTTGYVILTTGRSIWGAGLFLEPDRLLCRLPKNMKRAVAQGEWISFSITGGNHV